MRITEIRPAGLRFGTPEGGWTNEIRPDDCVHTLIAVFTDEGVMGWGSCFANDALVRGALDVLEPLYRGENPIEPERVSEKLHANTFWMGRGGPSPTLSAASISRFGTFWARSPGNRWDGCWADATAIGRGLTPPLLMREPERMADELLGIREQGFRAFKIGWGPFGRQRFATDEAIVRAARDAVGAESLLMVDAGASDAFWPQDYKWALRDREHAYRIRCHWFEEPLDAGQP